MVCALSALPGTIQLARQRVVTARFMLGSLICLSRLYNPSAPTTFLSLLLYLALSVSYFCIDKKAEATSRLRLFLSYSDEPRATFAVGIGDKKTLLSRGSWNSGEKCDGDGDVLHLYNAVCERC